MSESCKSSHPGVCHLVGVEEQSIRSPRSRLLVVRSLVTFLFIITVCYDFDIGAGLTT